MKTVKNISYSTDNALQELDLYLPDGEAEALFVYFHGGGLEHGDKSAAKIFASYLTERGIALISANYRMYPEFKYPDFIFDAAAAVKWGYDYMRCELGCKKLYVGGSSAGGYLSMMLCFDSRYLADIGLSASAVNGYFHDAGQPTAHYNVLKYSGIDSRRVIVEETAPLYYVGLETGYPPMRFIVSDRDMKNRYEQTMLMLTTLSHFGHAECDYVLMHGTHCEYCRTLDEHGDSVLGKLIFDFISKLNG